MTQPQNQGQQAGRPGRMTAVMRAMPVATGPKVLRIGLVQSGKVLEERVIKQRTSVTVGSSEKNTFVVLAQSIPPNFKLFELVGSDYYLNFVDGMTGRVALQTGTTDLAALKSQAKRSAQGSYQVKLSEDARGKVVIDETTFLFQFVAPPPVQPKPQLPSSVQSGMIDSIDWSMTIIAAFSFLFHFGAIGTLYSDWADKVLPDEADVQGIVLALNKIPPPPPPETPKEEDDTDKPVDKDVKPDKPTQSATASKGGSNNSGAKGGATGGGKLSASEGAAIAKQLAAMDAAVLGVLGSGPATQNVLQDGNVPTGSLDGLAKQDAAVAAGGTNGLKMAGGGGAVAGTGGRTLADAATAGKGSGSTQSSGQAAAVAAPKASVGGGGSVSAGKLSGADRVLAGARARARACYQTGLNSNPDMEGRASFTLTISGSGSVSSANVSTGGSLSPSVGSCIKAALQGLSFDAPEGGTATISGSFSFVNSNKGKLAKRHRPRFRLPRSLPGRPKSFFLG